MYEHCNWTTVDNGQPDVILSYSHLLSHTNISATIYNSLWIHWAAEELGADSVYHLTDHALQGCYEHFSHCHLLPQDNDITGYTCIGIKRQMVGLVPRLETSLIHVGA